MTARQRGATLVELLVALALLALASSIVAALTIPVLAAFEADPAAADAQHRVRAALHALLEDVQRAGSGFVLSTEAAPGAAQPSLLPDAVSAGAWAMQARAGTITTWHARRGASHGALRAAVVPGDTVLPLARAAFCSGVTPTCGFQSDDEVLLFTAHGRIGVATVRQVDTPLDLVLTAPLADAWPAGTIVSAITSHTYELRPDASTGLSQIVRRLGAGPATPVVDFVTRFDVEWIVDAGAPQLYLAPDGTEEHATAAPAPPPPGVVADPAWPAGENCAFFRDAAGMPHWRGSTGGPAPAAAAPGVFIDGPWCPSAAAPVRWDADLARIAEARIVLGVAAAATTLRPPVGLGLARPGGRIVPDLVVETTARPGRRSGGA